MPVSMKLDDLLKLDKDRPPAADPFEDGVHTGYRMARSTQARDEFRAWLLGFFAGLGVAAVVAAAAWYA